MLVEEFLKPLGLTQRELADAIGVPYQRVNEIVNQRRGITPSTALRLSQYFGIRRHPHAISQREASA
jgi:addiction module HigA family antidote